MKRQYSSFLIRCWLLDGGQQRIKIEHVQSGQVIQVSSPAAAIAWIGARWDELYGKGADEQRQPEYESEQDMLPENP